MQQVPRGEALTAIGFTLVSSSLFAWPNTAPKYVVPAVPQLMLLCGRYLVLAPVSSAWLLRVCTRATS